MSEDHNWAGWSNLEDRASSAPGWRHRASDVVLTPGMRLGPYEVQDALGAGGMGEVYRARDSRLHRTVAVKVLAPHLAADPEFRERFEREARTISQLSHPHICTLYDIGRTSIDGTSPSQPEEVEFLVMEYLEGETLAARLGRGPLPLAQTLDASLEIVDALDKAHRRGIVHRDLKPANVMMTKSGTKLLDFGLAKFGLPSAVGSLETVLATPPSGGTPRQAGAATPLTSQGSLLGTLHYMSPEQLEGREVDGRADIWAFGCVLHEMLTGQRAFDGRTHAGLIASILERDPSIVTEQPSIPSALNRIVRRCLAKDPENRFQTARDLWLELQWSKEAGSTAGLAAPPLTARRARTGRALWVTSALAIAALTGAAAWWLKPAPRVTPNVVRQEFYLGEGQAFSRIGRRYVAISPDGTKLAYVANQQLYLRLLDRLEAEPLRGADRDPLEPVFSPDSQWIAYFVAGSPGTRDTLKKIKVTGGTPLQLCVTDQPYGVTWQHGLIAFGQNTDTRHEIDAIADGGGDVRTLVTLAQGEGRAIEPSLLDDGRHLLFVIFPLAIPVGSGPDNSAQIVLMDLDNGRRTPLLQSGTSPEMLPTGDLLFIHDASLMVVPLNVKRAAVVGGAVPVLEGVNETLISWAGQFSVSRTGTLVYSPGSPVGDPRELVWVDRRGREERLTAPSRAYLHPRLSPDGARIAVDVLGEDNDIWIWDMKREVPSRLTFGPAIDMYPVWMNDSRRIIYRSLASGASGPDIFRKSADGAGVPEALTTNGRGGEPTSISPDDRSLTLRSSSSSPDHPWAVFVLSLEDHGPAERLLDDPQFSQLNGEISPDGHYIAYQSAEFGRNEILVRPFPNITAGRWQVSAGGGAEPVWSRTGHEIFFRQGTHMMAVSVQTGATQTFGQQEALFDLGPYSLVGGPGRRYDVAPDGRFLLSKPIRSASGGQTLVVVSNWFEELKALTR